MPSVRIALVADIHHGADTFSKKGSAALPLLEEFRRFVADARPDVVIDLGDRISDESREADARREREVADAFCPIRACVPTFHLCGNHDRDFLSVEENAAILGQDLGHMVVDLEDWRLVLWRADTLIRRPGGFLFSEAGLAWLAETIAVADRPLLVASHVPVSGHSQIGNHYFERNPGAATYPQAHRVRALLRNAAVPVLWVSGHVHWNTITTVDGIVHLTQQSLTETFTSSGTAAGAYGLLELGPDSIDWQVHGLDALRMTLPVAPLARRWFPPLPPFDEIAGHRERHLRVETLASPIAAR